MTFCGPTSQIEIWGTQSASDLATRNFGTYRLAAGAEGEYSGDAENYLGEDTFQLGDQRSEPNRVLEHHQCLQLSSETDLGLTIEVGGLGQSP